MKRFKLFVPFGDLVSALVAEFTSGGLQHLKSSKLLAETKEVVRHRLLREVRLNVGILSEMSDSPSLAVSALDTSALKQLFEQPLDLTLFFSKSLPKEATTTLTQLRKKGSPNRSLSETLTTEDELIQLLMCRVVVATARLEQSVSASEVKLLKVLFEGVKKSLEHTQSQSSI